jgi:hypothetical protein
MKENKVTRIFVYVIYGSVGENVCCIQIMVKLLQ